MTQLECEDKIRQLRQEREQKKTALRQMYTMKLQERKIVKNQLDALYTKDRQLGAEITAISQQIQEINVQYDEKVTNLKEEYWSTHEPIEYKRMDATMAHHTGTKL